MKFILEPVSGPELEVVTLARMKRELDEFASITEFDDDITAKIVAGREWVERLTGRALVDQSWRLTIDQAGDAVATDISLPNGSVSGPFNWAASVGEILVRKSPALAITSFVTVDAAGAETAIDTSTYALREADSKWPRIVPLSGATWASAPLMRIVFRAGFADRTGSPVDEVTVVPECFKQAIILWVKAMHDFDPEISPKTLKAAADLVRYQRSEFGFA